MGFPKLVIPLLLFLFTHPLPAISKVYIDINAPSPRKAPLAVQDFIPMEEAAGGTEAFGEIKKELDVTLSGDINFSGLFNTIGKEAYLEEPSSGITSEKTNFRLWRAIGAEFLIKGGIKIKEKTLTVEFRLFDTIGEKELFARRYLSRPEGARQIAHRFSDDLMELL
ncbi:MAG: hypothetical protein HY883_03995, partial [Deltaproteobacteria bacterium]|nr:hypothetical protein [Deltaproteobacteria bacterium]